MKNRVSIPSKIKRQLMIEAGYHCSIPNCKVDSALDFHHIDKNPLNNSPDNLLVVCSNHHRACTKGSIDKKACIQIKRLTKPQDKSTKPDNLSIEKLRKILREELSVSSFKFSVKEKTIFPSVLDRNYLFNMIDKYIHFIDISNKPSCHLYLAVTLIGELKCRGGSKKIISLVNAMKNSMKKKKIREYDFYYRTAIESLTKIGSKESLNWLADEYLQEDREGINKFIIYLALAGQKKSRSYVGFRILEMKKEGTDKKGISTISFTLRGRQYKCILKYGD